MFWNMNFGLHKPADTWQLLLFVKMYRVEIDTNEFRNRVNLEFCNENGRVQWLRHLILTQVARVQFPRQNQTDWGNICPGCWCCYFEHILLLTKSLADQKPGLHQQWLPVWNVVIILHFICSPNMCGLFAHRALSKLGRALFPSSCNFTNKKKNNYIFQLWKQTHIS